MTYIYIYICISHDILYINVCLFILCTSTRSLAFCQFSSRLHVGAGPSCGKRRLPDCWVPKSLTFNPSQVAQDWKLKYVYSILGILEALILALEVDCRRLASWFPYGRSHPVDESARVWWSSTTDPPGLGGSVEIWDGWWLLVWACGKELLDNLTNGKWIV